MTRKDTIKTLSQCIGLLGISGENTKEEVKDKLETLRTELVADEMADIEQRVQRAFERLDDAIEAAIKKTSKSEGFLEPIEENRKGDVEMKIKIKKTLNADTRTATEFTKIGLLSDTKKHIEAVSGVLGSLALMLFDIGDKHDYTKTKYIDEFFKDFQTKKTGADFKALGWWQKHLAERHHLNDRCPDDVNLLDVIEMIADCVCAGLARSGNIYGIEISNEILQKAVLNTKNRLIDMIEVVE